MLPASVPSGDWVLSLSNYAGNEKSAINISTPKGIEFNSRVLDSQFQNINKARQHAKLSLQRFLCSWRKADGNKRRSNLYLDKSMVGYMDFVLPDLLSKKKKVFAGQWMYLWRTVHLYTVSHVVMRTEGTGETATHGTVPIVWYIMKLQNPLN